MVAGNCGAQTWTTGKPAYFLAAMSERSTGCVRRGTMIVQKAATSREGIDDGKRPKAPDVLYVADRMLSPRSGLSQR